MTKNAAAKRIRFVAATIAMVVLSSGCGGSPNTPNGPYVGYPGNPGPPPTKLVDVKVTVTVPAAGRKLRPNYLSYSTKSLAVQLVSVNGNGVTGVSASIINTLPKSRGCKSQGQGNVCSASVKGSPGSDVFSVTSYAGTDATGAVLSVGTVAAKIAGNGGSVGISNRIPLTLDGVIASLRISLEPNKAKRGDRTTAAVTLDAYDASGAEIVGPSDYLEPIALAIQGDTNKSFLLHDGDRSGQSLPIRKPTSGLTLTYDGNKQGSPISVVATVSGPSGASKSAGFDLVGKQPPPPVGTIYALNLGSNEGVSATVTEYSGKAKGNAAPERTLNLSSKLYARTIAVDSSGNIYVGYLDNQYGYSFETGEPDPANEIAMYAPDASGNDQPTAVLVENKNKATATTLFPIFISFDPSGRLVTYGATVVDGNAGDAVLTYPAGSTGDAVPEYGWNFGTPTLRYSGPTGLAIDSSNNFYVNGSLHTSLGPSDGLFVNPASQIGDPTGTPSRTILWSDAELTPGLTFNVALNQSGEIFIGNAVTEGSGSSATCQGRANVYAAGASGGSDKPLRILTFSGVSTKNCQASKGPLLGFFPSIQLYGPTLFAADDYNNAIDAFASDANGTVKPSLQIAGSATQLDAPIALVITSVSGGATARPVTGARAPEPSKHSLPLAKGKST
ncbi:MAG: hypothetical protein ABSD52_14220 [Candidatus Cybelea sp.]